MNVKMFCEMSVTAGVLLAVFLFCMGALSVLDGDRENDAAQFALFCMGK